MSGLYADEYPVNKGSSLLFFFPLFFSLFFSAILFSSLLFFCSPLNVSLFHIWPTEYLPVTFLYGFVYFSFFWGLLFYLSIFIFLFFFFGSCCSVACVIHLAFVGADSAEPHLFCLHACDGSASPSATRHL